MTYTIVNASEWPLERLAPYMSDILGEMTRLAHKYAPDMTTASLFAEFLRGEKTLWLVLAEGNFVSMAMSTVRTVDSTGTKIATLCNLAGRNVDQYAPELCAALEQWADENDCSIRAVEGRRGWEPILARHGYKPYAVLFRKSR